MRIDEWTERQRAREVALCEALGLDPAKVISFEWDATTPQMVKAVILDGPTPDVRHTEDHHLPEEWRP